MDQKEKEHIITSFSKEEKENYDLLANDYRLAIETQRHFNELTMKFRTTAFTIIILFTSAGIGLFEKYENISLSIIFLNIFLVLAFRHLDINYYHQLLLGSVEKSMEIDNQFENVKVKLFSENFQLFGLSNKITNRVNSKTKHKDKGIDWDNSTRGINNLYLMASGTLLILLTVCFLNSDFYSNHCSSETKDKIENTIKSKP